MKNSAYDTYACADLKKSTVNIAVDINKHSILTGQDGQLKDVEGFEHNVKMIVAGPATIQTFGHPLRIGDVSSQNYYYVFDARGFTTVTRLGEVKISSAMDYQLAKTRAVLEIVAREHSPTMLETLGAFPVSIFTKWVAGQISSKLNLSIDAQIWINQMCAFLYICNLKSDTWDLTEEEKQKITPIIAQATGTASTSVFDFLDGVTKIKDIHEFITQVKAKEEFPQLSKFNLLFLISCISNGIMGFNSREICAVCLEHPPTFLAVIYTAFHNQGLKRTVLGELVYSRNKSDAAISFAKHIEGISKVINVS